MGAEPNRRSWEEKQLQSLPYYALVYIEAYEVLRSMSVLDSDYPEGVDVLLGRLGANSSHRVV
jgi:hypothetical protein